MRTFDELTTLDCLGFCVEDFKIFRDIMLTMKQNGLEGKIHDHFLHVMQANPHALQRYSMWLDYLDPPDRNDHRLCLQYATHMIHTVEQSINSIVKHGYELISIMKEQAKDE